MRRPCLKSLVVFLFSVLTTSAFAGDSPGVEFIDLGTFGDTGPFGFSITADGTRVGGSQASGLENCIVWAANPDYFLGNQTVLIDISRVKVCHAPPGNPANQRTLVISWGSVEEHVGHGDFLGSCEAAFAGTARARSAREHFGINPTNECLQNAVKDFMATHSPMLGVSIDVMERIIAAAEDCEGL